uniref:Arf-GAP domain-containing protein n=1 Tax=Junco hyemalis TaxID=40217 RepID=A0A8C5NMP7_JUNHY
MAAGSAGTGPGAGPGGGPGARRGSASRDAEAEVWCRRVRELVSAVPANRLCFECGQRGVTYVDISVGSFVCTGCSGALRGLNPPHRVKSISMTTFSEAEVLFLQAHGNEACRRVWLGTFDPRTSLLHDSHDPQKVKEFLQEKYEKKRWDAATGGTGPLLGVPRWERPPLTLRCPPSLAQLPEKPAPTSWLTSGGTPSPAQLLPPPSQPSLVSLGISGTRGGEHGALSPGPAPARSAFPAFDAFGTSPGAPTFGGAVPPFHIPPSTTGTPRAPGTLGEGPGRGLVPPRSLGHLELMGKGGIGVSSSLGVLGRGLGVPPSLHGDTCAHPPGYTNPFTAPVAPRPSTNPFEINGPGWCVGVPILCPLSQVLLSPCPLFLGASPAPSRPMVRAGRVKYSSTNPFVVSTGGLRGGPGPLSLPLTPPVLPQTVPAPAAPFGIRHRATNPFL